MEKYLICMDAGGNIDKKFLKENSVCFVPMEYNIGDELRICSGIDPDSDMKKFYAAQKEGKVTKTTQVTPFGYENYFKGILKNGYSILYISLSSGLSNTYQSSLLASRNLEEEYPNQKVDCVDSLAATGGIGVLVHRAIRNLKKGMSLKDNANDLRKAASTIHHYFMVEDLMYLKRGGRISASTAIIGQAFNIKPVLEINKEGKLITLAKKHGTKGALLDIFERFEKTYDPKSNDVIYICDADCQDKVDFVKNKILEKYPQAQIYTDMLCPVIGSHTGPGMIAVCYIGSK